MTEPVVAFVTTPPDHAERLARALVEPRLAACVNIVPAVQSFYWWDGKLQDDHESLLVVKTTRDRVVAIDAALKASHPYDNYEFIVLPIQGGNDRYLDWLAAP